MSVVETPLKIRFGAGLGRGVGPAAFPAAVEELERAGVDSLWLSEVVYAPNVDTLVGMAYALARTTKLKVGTGVAILPGRHPVLVAKQLASLAALAPKRVLPVFGLSPAQDRERDLFRVEGGRGAVFDESMRLLRRVLTEPEVTFEGRFFSVRSATIEPRPSRPLDIWLGGSSPAGLRRVGRLADGWLGSFLTPAEAGRARAAIEAAAAEAGREIEPDHYGISLTVAEDGIPPEAAQAARARRPDVEPASLMAGSWPALHRLLDGYLKAGLTKFVVRPAGPIPFTAFVERFAKELHPLEN
jgi:probable F420-dependent oxidoreductase